MKNNTSYKIAYTCLLFMLANLLPGSTIFGQQFQTFSNEQNQIRQDALLRAGPFLLSASFQSLFGYDNNVYGAGEEGQLTSDYFARISPQIRLYLLSYDFFTFSLSASPQYVYYAEQKSQRGWDTFIAPEMKFFLLNRFTISGRFLKSKQKYRPSLEFDVRVYENIESYGGTLGYESPNRISMGVTLNSRTLKYEDIVQEGTVIPVSLSLDRKEDNGNITFTYRLSPNRTFFVSAGYTEYEFAYPESQSNNSSSYQIYSGISFPLIGRVSGRLSLGYKKFVPRDKSREDFSGLVGDTSLGFDLGRFGFQLIYSRDIPFSYSSSIFFIDNRYGIGVSTYLTSFLRLEYEYFYGKTYYTEDSIIDLPDGSGNAINREDNYQNHSFGVVFRLIEKLGVRLALNYWSRNTNYSATAFNRAYIQLGLTYDF